MKTYRFLLCKIVSLFFTSEIASVILKSSESIAASSMWNVTFLKQLKGKNLAVLSLSLRDRHPVNNFRKNKKFALNVFGIRAANWTVVAFKNQPKAADVSVRRPGRNRWLSVSSLCPQSWFPIGFTCWFSFFEIPSDNEWFFRAWGCVGSNGFRCSDRYDAVRGECDSKSSFSRWVSSPSFSKKDLTLFETFLPCSLELNGWP